MLVYSFFVYFLKSSFFCFFFVLFFFTLLMISDLENARGVRVIVIGNRHTVTRLQNPE